MQRVLSTLAALAALAWAAGGAPAAPKEVKLEGTLVCTKCSLKQTKACGNALVVKEGGKDVTYYLDDKGKAESYHEAVCGGETKPAVVVGTVTEKDGKKYVKATKVTLAEK